ncbi:Shikimate kinase 1 [Pseudovibrio axinellae]|uniref:Shikimate kinase n=1 Tax=Pseudovibrio axinellae TaxID=989403 RepID=A0A165WZ06_9HYPH|nr:shikimate kinase [Pseudovibrio axinellae]KZL17055.1 Shikimate kinase 1 [Pseudovibrio axinellae]SEQ17923.1 shikimate kinase [Pseudovibrio axinellae]
MTANDTKSDKKRQRQQNILERLGNKPIVLVGIMGCGKSTVGRRLAQYLALNFIDADSEIEKAADRSISEIFAEHGESYFRQGEKRVIARLLDAGPQVLATGGGAFINDETRSGIKEKGVSVWMKAELPVIMARVRKRPTRPLLQTADPEATMKKLMDERYPIYEEADMTIWSHDVTHEAVMEEILNALEDGLPPLAKKAPDEQEDKK